MGHIARRLINLTFALLLAVFSVNLSGVLAVQNAQAVSLPHYTAAPATHVDACGSANDTYTIPSTTSSNTVLYSVLTHIGSSNVWLPVTQSGTKHGTGTVHIKATNLNFLKVMDQPDSWDFTFDPNQCATTGTPSVATDPCGTENDTFNIPETAGVNYYVGNQLMSAGPHSTGGQTSVTVTAVAQEGYTLVDSQTSWTLTFNDESCIIPVTPKAPVPNDVCGASNDFYSIPETEGVTYLINGKTVSGDYKVKFGQNITVTAVANQGYEIAEGATSEWSHHFSFLPCWTKPDAPTMNEQCGTENDYYTIPDQTEDTHVKYYVNGQVKTPGVHYTNGNDVLVIAVPDQGYAINIFKVKAAWYFNFSKKACAVPCNQQEETQIIEGDGPRFQSLSFLNNENNFYEGNDDNQVPCIPSETSIPADPTSNDICGTDVDTYSVVPASGIVYKANGVTLSGAGPFKTNGALTVTITAEAAQGYTLLGGKQTWTYHFTDVACTPGKGSFGGTTPSTPAKLTGVTLPETGTNPLSQLISVLAAGFLTYAVTYLLVNRRDLQQK